MLLLSGYFGFGQDGWTISTADFRNYHAPTLANGMIGITPSLKTMQVERVMLNGVYDRYGSWGDGIENIVQGIDFLNLDLQMDSGTWLSAVPIESLSGWEQSLDLREAYLHTHFVYEGKLDIQYSFYALRGLPYNGLLTVELRALKDADIHVINVFKGSPSARIYAVKQEKIARVIPLGSVLASSPTGKVVLAAATTFLFEASGSSAPAVTGLCDPMNNSRGFVKHLKQGETFRFALSGAECASSQFPDPKNEAKRFALAGHLQGVAAMIQHHRENWAKLWSSDIEISGDFEAQQVVRVGLYNLYSNVREGTGLSMSPMGLSSADYNGHIFWDCEIWMFPVILVMHPEMAKSILDYRFKHLEQAKQNAVANGYRGAMFPWESAGDGTEETPVWALTGPFEHHITADIGIACWNYFLVSRDTAWLKEKGFPILSSVADFWVSRSSRNQKGEYEIKNVVCADEYAENVNNNAFTNGAAKVVLRDAVRAAGVLHSKVGEGWKEVAAGIPLRFFADSVIKEYENYDGRTIKQADANLLSYPLNLFSPKESRLALEYYTLRVDKAHGPAMTFGIFSVIASRIGEPGNALDYLKMAYKPNMRPPFFGFAETADPNDKPYFNTGAGAILQAALFGFGGLEIGERGVVRRAVKLPEGWKTVRVKVEGREFRVRE